MAEQTDVIGQCGQKIKWGPGATSTPSNTSVCDKPAGHPTIDHEGPGLPEFSYQRIHWQDGDRRQFTGDFIDCPATTGCILPSGHHGRCAT